MYEDAHLEEQYEDRHTSDLDFDAYEAEESAYYAGMGEYDDSDPWADDDELDDAPQERRSPFTVVGGGTYTPATDTLSLRLSEGASARRRASD